MRPHRALRDTGMAEDGEAAGAEETTTDAEEAILNVPGVHVPQRGWQPAPQVVA